MAFTENEQKAIGKALDEFMEIHRPSEKIRAQIDLSFSIDNQSVTLFEIRPSIRSPKEMTHSKVAKATYVRTERQWKIYWEKSDFKWHSYSEKPIVKSFKAFLKIVGADKLHCFFG